MIVSGENPWTLYSKATVKETSSGAYVRMQDIMDTFFYKDAKKGFHKDMGSD
jgi:hypothetical protein